MEKNKNTLEFLLFLLSSIILICGGVFLISYPFVGILAVFIGLVLQCRHFIKTSSEINKKIRGEGIEKITVSNRQPTEPNEGDLWVDTRK